MAGERLYLSNWSLEQELSIQIHVASITETQADSFNKYLWWWWNWSITTFFLLCGSRLNHGNAGTMFYCRSAAVRFNRQLLYLDVPEAGPAHSLYELYGIWHHLGWICFEFSVHLIVLVTTSRYPVLGEHCLLFWLKLANRHLLWETNSRHST